MSSAQNSATTVQEYVIRVPKNNTKKHHVMRFNSVLNVDFSRWNQVKMERENNMKEYRGLDDEMPKYGAGSEFGRDQREEARRKKFGIVTKKYRPEDQPWILKVGGKTGKKFKGIREGGVGENAAYYVFTHAPDGAIDAFPLREWYNFQPIQRYKALSAEEAEQEFGRRNKVMNYFSLMLRKRLRNDEDGDMEDLEEGRKGIGGKGPGGKGSKGRGELKISDMDEWVDSDGGDDNSDEDDGDKEKDDDEVKDKKGKGKKGADKKGKAKKKRRDSNDEAFEESDDGDEEGREVDYISDSSDSELDHEENVKDSMKGVAEEDALRKLLTSDEEDDEEREGGDDEDGDEDKAADGDKGDDGDGDGKKGGGESDGEDDKKGGSNASKKKKPKGGKKDTKKKDPSSILNDSSSNYSSDSSDSETKKKHSKGKETNSGNSSRAATPTKNSGNDGPMSSASSSSSTAGGDGNKRKADLDNLPGSGSTKKPRLDGLLSSASSDSGITEEAVRRYLMRKPMTTTELLQKFKSKKTGLSSELLVNVMTQILKRINPIKQTIKGKMYLSIKA